MKWAKILQQFQTRNLLSGFGQKQFELFVV